MQRLLGAPGTADDEPLLNPGQVNADDPRVMPVSVFSRWTHGRAALDGLDYGP